MGWRVPASRTVPETIQVGTDRSAARAAVKLTADPAHQKAKKTQPKSRAKMTARRNMAGGQRPVLPDSPSSQPPAGLVSRQSQRHIPPRVLIILQFSAQEIFV